MGDDTIQRLFTKIDENNQLYHDLSDRLARVETMLAEREKNQTNIAGIIAWLVTTAIAV